METLKQRVISLEKQIVALHSTQQHTTPRAPIHTNYAVLANEEFGVHPLEELNVWRFIYSKEGDSFRYSLLNPSNQMPKEGVQLRSFVKNPADIETKGYEITFPTKDTQFVQSELDKYPFVFSDICKCNIRPVTFDQEITLSFQNEYSMLPHVHAFILPVPNDLMIRLKSLSTKECTFIIQFPRLLPNELYHERNKNVFQSDWNSQLHFHVQGVQQKNTTEENDLLDISDD